MTSTSRVPAAIITGHFAGQRRRRPASAMCSPQAIQDLGPVETAKLIRKAFGQAFKDVDYHVISGHMTVNVTWTNGPTRKQVEDVLSIYSDVTGYDNGDSPIRRNGWLDGKPTRFVEHVSLSRKFSPEMIESTKAAIAAMHDVERRRFRDTLVGFHRESPWHAISLCEMRESKEIKRVGR